ncbi:MAG: hypothetical protein MUC36_07535 [Planctomycetes bacterium]|jgi:hypothetical protein|nr:hypothetical protein [Planctomycetota bacterium]
MITTKSLSAGLALVVSVASAFVWVVPGSPQKPPQRPYQVVISKQIQSPAHRVGTSYREHEELTEMMNQLDKDGLRPLMTELLTQTAPGLPDEIRMLVVCVPK